MMVGAPSRSPVGELTWVMGEPTLSVYRYREEAMLWKKPKVLEIAIGLEINSYACAVVK
jgi:coenzyme PQQ precursor peptide PqqA